MTDKEKIRIKSLELAVGLISAFKTTGMSIKEAGIEHTDGWLNAKLLVDGTITISKEFETFILEAPDEIRVPIV
jgi:hypothetical protein